MPADRRANARPPAPPPSSVWSADLNCRGWQGISRASAQAQALVEHLTAHNSGIPSLDDVKVEPQEVERAKRIFDAHGFVVVKGALDASQLARIRAGVATAVRGILDTDASLKGNRGSHRYSFGSCSKTRHMSHDAAWAQLVDLPTTGPILAHLLGRGFMCSGMGGDFSMPGAVEFQPLHSDLGGTVVFNGETVDYRDAPTYQVAVNFLPQDFTPLNGPLRQIMADPSGVPTQTSQKSIPTLEDEPEAYRLSTLLPATAGCAVIRDPRAWHGGTPNVSAEMRAIPNVEYYSAWHASETAHFKPSMPREVFDGLSEEGRRLCARIVAAEGEQLELGWWPRPEHG